VLAVAGLSTCNSLPKRPRDSFRSLSVLAVFLKHSSFQSSNMERKCADTIGRVRVSWAGHFQR